MERENLSEAKLAWLLWQLLQELSDLLWDHYEEEFLDFVLEEDMALYGESDKTRPHP